MQDNDPGRGGGVEQATDAETHRWQLDHIRQGLGEAEAGKFASAAEVKRVITHLRRT